MRLYALIWEAFSDDHRLLGLYSSIDAARSAWRALLDSDDGYPYQFYHIERRDLDGAACQCDESFVVFER